MVESLPAAPGVHSSCAGVLLPLTHCTEILLSAPPVPHEFHWTDSCVPGNTQPVLGVVVTEAKGG